MTLAEEFNDIDKKVREIQRMYREHLFRDALVYTAKLKIEFDAVIDAIDNGEMAGEHMTERRQTYDNC